MAKIRLWQSGAEVDAENSHNLELNTIYGGFTASNTQKKTGDYSYRYRENLDGGIIDVSNLTQFRIGQHYRHNDSSDPRTGIVVWYGADINDPIGAIAINVDTIQIITGGYEFGTIQAISGSVFSNDTWYNLGIDVKIDNSVGWISVYVDGNLVVSWAGNTGNVSLNHIQLGPFSSLAPDFYQFVYIDDIYIDDSAGEGSYAFVDDLRFELITPNGDGAHSGCVGQDGDSTYNYQNVDEQPHDSDTTFNRANTLDDKDTYAMTTVSISGFTMRALIPLTIAKKLSGSIATEIALVHREGAIDVEGTYQSPGTDYGLYWDRAATPPVGAAWNQTYLDNVEVGFVAKGEF